MRQKIKEYLLVNLFNTDRNMKKADYLKVRNIFQRYVPDGCEPKLKNIPDKNLKKVYAELEKIND